MTTVPKALAGVDAIAGHKATEAAYIAAAASGSCPYDDDASDAADNLSEAKELAFGELAETPCTSDAEFLEKLGCLIAREVDIFGDPFELNAEFAAIARAVALHFKESLTHNTT